MTLAAGLSQYGSAAVQDASARIPGVLNTLSPAASYQGGVSGTAIPVGVATWWNMMILGFFLAIVLHHVALFVGGRRRSGDLAFSLVMVLAAARVALLEGPFNELAPAGSPCFPRLAALTLFPLLPGYVNFVRTLFPKEVSPRFVLGVAAASFVCLAAGLFLPFSAWPWLSLAFALVSVACMVAAVESLHRAHRASRSAVRPVLVGTTIFGLTLLMDVAYCAGWLDPLERYLTIGWIAVAFVCSAGLGKRIQDSYETAAEVSRGLERQNEELEAVVEQRTRELREINDELRRMAETDALTGIANRRRFEAVFAEENRRAVRSGSTLSVGMFDVDYFKYYNDTYGHVEGDACLKKVAVALAAYARRPGDLAARYGGEEFAILLPETEPEGALATMSAAAAAVQSLGIPHEGSPFKVVTISAGVASSTGGRGSVVEDADRALYAAKEAGRNLVRVTK